MQPFREKVHCTAWQHKNNAFPVRQAADGSIDRPVARKDRDHRHLGLIQLFRRWQIFRREIDGSLEPQTSRFNGGE